MGRIYWLTKGNFVADAAIEIAEVEFVIHRTLSENNYQQLQLLIRTAEEEIAEVISTFAKETFIKDSDSKEAMHFNVCLAIESNDIIGYGLSYCILDDPSVYYIDTIFVNSTFRGRRISREIMKRLIASVLSIDSVTYIKANTQDSNTPAISLLESFGFGPTR